MGGIDKYYCFVINEGDILYFFFYYYYIGGIILVFYLYYFKVEKCRRNERGFYV